MPAIKLTIDYLRFGYVFMSPTSKLECIRVSHFLLHAISYEPCMLGFWNFICVFIIKNSWPPFFFLSGNFVLLSHAPLKKAEWNLVSKISRKLFELETSWKGMMSRLPDYLLNKFHKIFPELWSFANLGNLNLSARYLKTIELEAWNLVSW